MAIPFLVYPVLAAIGAGAWALAWKWAQQSRREGELGRQAVEMGLRFSPDDPFDMPRRYADFTIMLAGHSPRATNITYGRVDEFQVRAFDFRYEVGHGPRRMTRRYSVVVAEGDGRLPRLVAWNLRDAEGMPLLVERRTRPHGRWAISETAELASMLDQAAGPLAEAGVSVECDRSQLMLMLPAGTGHQGYVAMVGLATGLARRLTVASDSAAGLG